VNEYFIKSKEETDSSVARKGEHTTVDELCLSCMKGILRERLPSSRFITVDVEEIDLSLTINSELLNLDNALTYMDPRLALVVELLHFGGFSQDEVAQILDVSPRTIRWNGSKARSWLAKELGPQGSSYKTDARTRTPLVTAQLITFNRRLYEWLLEDTTR
jgi:RNA polymerase sigma factor (sigma-70 family)